MTLDKIAVIGATGQIGRLTLEILQERNFPADKIVAIADDNLANYNFSNTDLAFFCLPDEKSIPHMIRAANAGCVVIDALNYFRTDPDVPIIIPEVNGDQIYKYAAKNIICGANCAAIQMLMALKPLHDSAHIKRIIVSTYHSASGLGYRARQELKDGSAAHMSGEEFIPDAFPRNLAFDVIPQAEKFMDDGSGRTTGEWKMEFDAHEILGEKIPIAVTCVRVPVDVGHSESINVEFKNPISAQEATAILKQAPGIIVQENDEYATPAEITGTDAVYVSRIRKDQSAENALSLWVVADNLRKGAALNAVQTAECWLDFVSQSAEIPLSAAR